MLPLRIRMIQNFPTNTGCLCLDVHTWHLHISKYRYCVDIGDISSFTQCSSKQRGFKIANLRVCYGILEKINLRLFPFISHCLWAFEKSKWKLKVRRFFIRINTFYEMWWMHAPTHVFSLEEEMQTETECHCQYPHAHKNVFIYGGIWHHHFVMFLFMSDWIVDCCSGHKSWPRLYAVMYNV